MYRASQAELKHCKRMMDLTEVLQGANQPAEIIFQMAEHKGLFK